MIVRHSLTRVDETARTATCSECGPGAPVWRHKRTKWRCATAQQRRRQAERLAPIVTRADRPPLGTPCEVCGGGGKPLVWDHNHQTGAFRGWCCSNCNAGLGMFRDDPVVLAAAIQYLISHDRKAAAWPGSPPSPMAAS